MTTPSTTEFESPQTANSQSQVSSPRKRRKRAPAAGAAADCFTCSSLNLQCDRRRPYCSQCLDEGRDCSGYKTQLTWGVGVASRGKLRGLSLPIAGTQRLASSAPPTKQKKRSSVAERKSKPQNLFVDPFNAPKPEVTSPSTARSDASFEYARSEYTSGNGPPSSTTSWQTSPQVDRSDSSVPVMVKIEQTLPSPASYQNTFAAKRHESPSVIPGSTNAYGNIRHETTGDTGPYLCHSSAQRPQATNPGPIGSDGAYWSTNGAHMSSMNVPISQMQNSQYLYNPNLMNLTFPVEVAEQNIHLNRHTEDESNVEIGRSNVEDDYAVVDELSPYSVGLAPTNYCLSLSPFAGTGNIGKTPRMQYLINYYTEVISPVIVAFDGPSNPYRTQILHLAAGSETLQHAISALSASNLRQRTGTGWVSTGKTDPARRSSIAHLTLTDRLWSQSGPLTLQDRVREESFHRGLAISALNAQLADPVRRKDDSTLAILLILCLFHICDSGVAKFQTQFAGVKKLLKLRGEDLAFNTKETKWFTRMFTWFDAMTATVNDREGQLQGYHLEISASSDEEWALENLAGCDGQLFKTIAKLGRLNVLSQGKAVDLSPTIVSRPLPMMPTPIQDYGHFDGNGWARLIADEDLFSRKTADADVQTQFWREWREIRQALQTWHLDTTMFDSASSEAPLLTHDQRIDLANISESFRYSALLYTERLASPSSSSSDPHIQAWVRQSIEFIKQVKSDVYLLWPLFITGSECVNEVDRGIIRQRCVDIQKDSGFFNNQSCLELLEKVWTQNPSTLGETHSRAKNEDGFKFSSVMRMEGNEGEYIVV